MHITKILALILAMVLLTHVPATGQALPPAKNPPPRWPDEVALSVGAVRLGSAALKFRDGVHGVVFLADGKRFATINHHRIRIFETATAKEVRGWKADDHALLAIAATPDGKRLASGGNNEMIRIWDADTGKLLREFNKHRGAIVYKLAFSSDGKYLVSEGSERKPGDRSGIDCPTDQGLRVWDAETGSELPAFKDGLPAARSGEFTPDGKHLIWQYTHGRRHPQFHMRPLAGGADRVWEVKDAAKWELPFAYLDSGLEPRESGVLRWHFVIWDGSKKRELRRYPLEGKSAPQVGFYQVRFSPDRSIVACGGEFDEVLLWYPAQGTRRTLGPGRGIYGLDFSRDGKTLIACGGYDLRLFDVATGKEHGAIGHRLSVRAVAISPDQKRVATAGADGTVRLWDRATGAEKRVLRGHDGAVLAVAFISNESVASGGKDGTVRIWKVDADKEERRFLAHKGGTYSLAISKNGKMLASGGEDDMIRIWDTATWKESKVIKGHQGRIVALVFAPDNLTLYSGSDGSHPRFLGEKREHSFRMWDLATINEVRRFPDDPWYPIRSIALSADGKLAVSNVTSRDKGIGNVWDTATGKSHAQLPPLDGWIQAVALSPDGKTLAVARGPYMIEDNLILIDTASWRIKAKLAGHPNPVNALAFSTDGQFLVSGSDDGSAVVWDMTKGMRPR